MEINRVIENMQYSLIRTLKEEAKNYPNVIDLTVGEPDLETPKELILETFERAKNLRLGYPPTGGSESLREMIAKNYNKKYETSYEVDNIIINVGATEALSSCFKTILNPEDEVIIFSPFYTGYPSMIKLCHCKPVVIDISKNDYVITKKMLEENITNKTKAILFCNPSNPTGNLMSFKEMEEIANYLSEKDLFIISDEIYSELSFEDFFSFGRFENIKDKLIIVNGFSKSHSMTGWRLGYTIFPKKYRKNFLNSTLFTLSSPMAISLIAGEVALEKFSDRREVRDIYKERANYMYEELKKLGFKPVKPKGAFYILVDYSNISNLDSYDFSIDVLKKVEVAIVPGIAFGIEKHFRLSLIQDKIILKEVIERLKKYQAD